MMNPRVQKALDRAFEGLRDLRIVLHVEVGHGYVTPEDFATWAAATDTATAALRELSVAQSHVEAA